MCTREEGASAHTGVRRVRVSAMEQRETKIRRGESRKDTGRAFLDTHGHGGAPREKKQHDQQAKKTAKTIPTV